MRIGFAKDVHRLVRKRKLILGGVEINYKKGLISYSDGDVVLHSLVDAIFGALNIGDIGTIFPDNNSRYHNCSSLYFLKEASKKIEENKCTVSYIDIFISCEEPKLKPYVEFMKLNIAQTLNIDIKRVSIKVGTNERLGYIGRKRGIEAFSAVLLNEMEDK